MKLRIVGKQSARIELTTLVRLACKYCTILIHHSYSKVESTQRHYSLAPSENQIHNTCEINL